MRLVGFHKAHVEPGESTKVEITIDPLASNYPLSVWSYNHHDFVIPSGTFQVYVETSSANTSVAGSFTIEEL